MSSHPGFPEGYAIIEELNGSCSVHSGSASLSAGVHNKRVRGPLVGDQFFFFIA